MLSRRQGRLSRFRKNKRRLRERLRQRIFFRDRMMPEAMDKPRVVVLTGAGISAESGIQTFRAADGLWEEHRVEDVATPEGFARVLQRPSSPASAAGDCAKRGAPGAGKAGGGAGGSFSAGDAKHRQSSRKSRKPQHHSHARRTAQGAVCMEWAGAGVERGRAGRRPLPLLLSFPIFLLNRKTVSFSSAAVADLERKTDTADILSFLPVSVPPFSVLQSSYHRCLLPLFYKNVHSMDFPV